MNSPNYRLLIFASGSGTNFIALHQSCVKGELPARICALICDRKKAGALDYAREQQIPHHVIPPSDFESESAYIRHLESVVDREAPDLILLAGYLKKIPDRIVDRYAGKIINIHPSLLPKYGGRGWYGMRVHRAVIQNGERISGSTVHYVNKVYDDGPVIARSKVEVLPEDTPETLAEKIKAMEHRLYPEVVGRLLNNQSH